MDTQEIKTVIMVTPILINFILLFNRKKKWVKNKYKWYILILLSIVGIFLFYNPEIYKDNSSDQKLVQWAFLTPLIFSIIDFSVMKLSYLIHNRDIYLWLKGSNDIDERKLSGGKHVRASDRLFSFILLFSIIILPFFILFFIDKTK
jgi:hypothetical protein